LDWVWVAGNDINGINEILPHIGGINDDSSVDCSIVDAKRRIVLILNHKICATLAGSSPEF
jgi:hypothetical protein